MNNNCGPIMKGGYFGLLLIAPTSMIVGVSLLMGSGIPDLWDENKNVFRFGLGFIGIGVLACCGLFACHKCSRGNEVMDGGEEQVIRNDPFL